MYQRREGTDNIHQDVNVREETESSYKSSVRKNSGCVARTGCRVGIDNQRRKMTKLIRVEVYNERGRLDYVFMIDVKVETP